MINKEVIISVSILFIAQIIVWYQLNGQLLWKWAKDNPFVLALLGVPISYMFIIATKYGYSGFGTLWQVRLIGFATGMISFPIITYMMLGESISMKTGISMFLGMVIMLLQLL